MCRRGRVRRAVAALAAFVALFGLAACGESPPPVAPPPAPLRILLVNDDGWTSPGIATLRDALVRAGHQVTEIAPLTDRSSAGTGTTLSGDIFARQPTRDRTLWTVTGTPSDAVLFGLRAVLGSTPPDIVVAGVDRDVNVGISTIQSGNVGAALAAASQGFPAISIGTSAKNRSRPVAEDFERPANFTVRIIAALQEQRTAGATLMPRFTALNVNYPAADAPPRGVVAAPTANAPSQAIYYMGGRQPGSMTTYSRVNPLPDDSSDAALLSRNQVTLTDLSADLDRAAPPPRTAARLASLLRP